MKQCIFGMKKVTLIFFIISLLNSCTKQKEDKQNSIIKKSSKASGIAEYITKYDTVKKVHNTLSEIKSCEDKINLKLIREWGGETADENQAFFMPSDIDFDSKGNVYILDSGNSRIQVFDTNGNYIRTIGRKGQGPGEFISPTAMAINSKDDLITVEVGNGRFQILTASGEYVKGFMTTRITSSFEILDDKGKDIILTHNFIRGNPSPLFFKYDYDGKVLFEFGDHKFVNSKLSYMYNFACDREGNTYISYYGKPYIERYNSAGELNKTITYEIQPDFRDERIEYSLDYEDNYLFLIIADRNKTEKEKKIGYMIMNESGISLVNAGIDNINTDLYKLLVFHKSGKVIASKKIDNYAQYIFIKNDILSLIDRYIEMKIYEYQFSLFD